MSPDTGIPLPLLLYESTSSAPLSRLARSRVFLVSSFPVENEPPGVPFHSFWVLQSIRPNDWQPQVVDWQPQVVDWQLQVVDWQPQVLNYKRTKSVNNARYCFLPLRGEQIHTHGLEHSALRRFFRYLPYEKPLIHSSVYKIITHYVQDEYSGPQSRNLFNGGLDLK